MAGLQGRRSAMQVPRQLRGRLRRGWLHSRVVRSVSVVSRVISRSRVAAPFHCQMDDGDIHVAPRSHFRPDSLVGVS